MLVLMGQLETIEIKSTILPSGATYAYDLSKNIYNILKIVKFFKNIESGVCYDLKLNFTLR